MGRKVVSGYTGKMGRVFIGANEFCAEDWDITHNAEAHDTTNTCGGGAEDVEFGVERLEGTINYTWDIANNPYATPLPNLAAGKKHAETKLYINASSGIAGQDGPFFHFNMAISSHSNSIPVKGKVTGTITFQSYGTIVLPTGSETSGA